ncbi:MAG: alpha/beta hydrolase [Rhodoferax sp.]
MLALGGCAALDARLRLAIYRPTPAQTPAPTALEPVAQTVYVAGPEPGSVLSMWWWPQACANAPTLLYLHGTFRNLAGNAHKIAALHRAGFAVLALDYRGWGESSPAVPSEAGIVADAQTAWAELLRRQPNPRLRAVYGHSMGSGVAVALTAQLAADALGGLILESAFTGFEDVAREAGFWAGLLAQFTQERFASQDRIGQIRVPLLMLHGAQDDTVPWVLGRRLFDTAQEPKHWELFEAGHHSDLHAVDAARYQKTLHAFMLQSMGVPCSGAATH